MSPDSPTRTSELLLPPSISLSCINATLQPFLAAEIAVEIPAIPPPTTTRSKLPYSLIGDKLNFLRNNLKDE